MPNQAEPATVATCDEATLSSFFRMINRYRSEIEEKEQHLQTLMQQLQIEAGKTFKYDGQWYQICQRKKEGTMFFKELSAAPATWLNKKAREQRDDEPSESTADSHEPDQADVSEESGAFTLPGPETQPNTAASGVVIID